MAISLEDAGCVPYRKADLNATAVLACGSGHVHGYHIDNTANAAKTYVHLYNAASAAGVTVGTTPPVLSFVVPASGGTDMPISRIGIGGFSLGIVIAACNALTGNTNPTTAILVNFYFNPGNP